MKADILKKAKAIIKARRLAAIDRLEIETIKANANEEYCTLARDIKISTYNISKAIGNNENVNGLEDKHNQLLKDMQILKANIGLADNYNVCKLCNDTGVLEDGALCKCLKQAYYDVVREESGVQKLPQITFKSNNIDNIECTQKDTLKRLYKSMEKYCINFPNNDYKSILLRGKIGTGKSYLIGAVANEILNMGYTVQYLTAYEMNSLFDTYFFSDRKNKDEYLIDSMTNADLLIIDDLGTEAIKKNISLEHLLHVLDERVDKHTIVTTNLSNVELQNKYGERIFSRLCNQNKNKVIALDGDDLRFLKQK